MTPTEAIASIRASLAAGYSPSLSDIEVLIDWHEKLAGGLAAPTREAWDAVWLGLNAARFDHIRRALSADQIRRLYEHFHKKMLDAVLATQSPRNENE